MEFRGIRPAFGLALGLTLAACATTTTTVVDPMPVGNQPSLLGVQWRLTGAPGARPGSSLAGSGAGAAALQFTAERFSIQGPCNSHGGNWRRDGGRLLFGGDAHVVVSTKKLCPPEIMVRERALLAALMQPVAVEQEGPFLRLVAADGSAWRFDSRDVPPAEGRERIVQVAGQRVPCSGVAPMLCLQVRTQPGAPWQAHYGEIEGFDWQVGVEYVIRVRELPVANPPADGASSRWVLEEVLERSP